MSTQLTFWLNLLLVGPLVGLAISLGCRLAIVQLLSRFGMTEAGKICSGTVPSKLRCLFELTLCLLLALTVNWLVVAWFISLCTLVADFVTIVAFHTVAALRAMPEYKAPVLSALKKLAAGARTKLLNLFKISSWKRDRQPPSAAGNPAGQGYPQTLLLSQPLTQSAAVILPDGQPDPLSTVRASAQRLAAAMDELQKRQRFAGEFATLVASLKQYGVKGELMTGLEALVANREQEVQQQSLLVAQEQAAMDRASHAARLHLSGAQPLKPVDPRAVLEQAAAALKQAESILSGQH